MLISKEQHAGVSSILTNASKIYSEYNQEKKDNKVQWGIPNWWKLGAPDLNNTSKFVPPQDQAFDANMGKWILWSRIINTMAREGYMSMMDIGTGSGVFPALAASTGIVPYAIEPLDAIKVNHDWLEHYGYAPREHFLKADLSSFLVAVGMGAKK